MDTKNSNNSSVLVSFVIPGKQQPEVVCFENMQVFHDYLESHFDSMVSFSARFIPYIHGAITERQSEE